MVNRNHPPVNYRKINAKRFLDTVIKTKRIHKYDLIDTLQISESTYEKLKPYIEYKFADDVFYEKATKNWIWVREDNESSDKFGDG